MYLKMGSNARTLELIHVFIALLFLLFMFDNAISLRCLERERNALFKIKEGVFDRYDRLSSWRGKDCCKWHGVGCSNLTRHVVTLDFHSPSYYTLFLRGKHAFSSLVELHHLTHLDLSSNDFSFGQILEFIGSLRELKYLNLSHSGFTGTFSRRQIGNLTHLQTLDLGYNDYNLIVGNLEWLSSLRAIRYLDLSYIDLSNINWLQTIQKLSFLKELHLVGCHIRSPLPPITNSSHMSLAVFDLSANDFNSSSQPFYWLYNLSSTLVDVDFSHNVLQSPIPDVFRNMINLQNLRLRRCFLKGMIPKSLGNLSHLHSLDLAHNSFTGNLSELLNKWSVSAKSSIEVLDLSSNQLIGSLPDNFSSFSSLKKFYVSNNKLNDPFPESFGQHTNLVFLDLSSNQITGLLPNKLSFPSLKYLDLSNNTLKGRLTESIGQFPELIILDLSSNSFEDTITEIHFMKLSKLLVLDLSSNSLVLDVSSDWVPPFQLDVIALGNCKLGPHFPRWLRTQNTYYTLDIPHANISDVVPNWFWNLSPVLSYLNLSNNQMSGMIPDLSSKFFDLHVADFSSNQFIGPLPLIPPTIQWLSFSKNRMVGTISSICNNSHLNILLSNQSTISYLDLSDNLLSGELPGCWMQIARLNVLNLANNDFTGELPSSLGFLNVLESLHLRNNNFMGKLPSSLKYCRSLRLVDLGGNKLSGRIPEWIGIYLKSLIFLSISLNKFYGSIPPNICNLNNIQVLDISQNNISGYVPKCFNNFTSLTERNGSVKISISTLEQPFYIDQLALQCLGGKGQNGCQGIQLATNFEHAVVQLYFEHAVVQWKGQLAEFGKTLVQLKVIDLSSNKLTGEIPVELASLVALLSLNLSRNRFTGHIPQRIGQMRMLESLDLSKNLLSGEIPVGLGSLTFLSVLDLSNNNFSGRIPLGTQLQGFNSSVYGGNHELCGLPLANKCPGEGKTLVSTTSEDKNVEEDGDELITPGFYASLVLGFAVGFWGVFGTLQLKRSWRHALFQFLGDMKDRVYIAALVNMARIQRMRRG